MNWLKKIVTKWVREDWENERQKNEKTITWTDNVGQITLPTRGNPAKPSRSVDCEGGLYYILKDEPDILTCEVLVDPNVSSDNDDDNDSLMVEIP